MFDIIWRNSDLVGHSFFMWNQRVCVLVPVQVSSFLLFFSVNNLKMKALSITWSNLQRRMRSYCILWGQVSLNVSLQFWQDVLIRLWFSSNKPKWLLLITELRFQKRIYFIGRYDHFSLLFNYLRLLILRNLRIEWWWRFKRELLSFVKCFWIEMIWFI